MDYLCERLLSAGAEESAVARTIIDGLKIRPDRAIPLLERELTRTLTPDWKDAPLPAAGSAAEPALVRQIDNAKGMPEERFALCPASRTIAT